MRNAKHLSSQHNHPFLGMLANLWKAWCLSICLFMCLSLHMDQPDSYLMDQNTLYVQWPCFEHCSIFEIMWKNIILPDRPHMTIWRMCLACWIPKATNILSGYAILIAFPLQQWLHKYASLLHNMYIYCLSGFNAHCIAVHEPFDAICEESFQWLWLK